MSQSLLQTEMTDAVNTGIVDRADKSEKSLKSGLYSVGKKAATGGAASAALAAVTNGRKGGKGGSASNGASPKSRAGKAGAAVMAHNAVHGALEGSELEGADDLYNSGKGAYRAGRAIGRRISGKSASLDIKGAVKGAGKAAARGAVSDTLQGSELEGMDNVYDGARAGYHVVKGVKKRLGGENPLSPDKSLGKLSEKKSAKKAANTVEAKRKAQAAGYFKKNVYKTSENVKKAASITKRGIKILPGAGKGGLGPLASLGMSTLAIPIIILLGLVLLISLLGSMGGNNVVNQSGNLNNLSGIQLEVAQALYDSGLNTTQVAAVMGNISGESSDWNPTSEYHGENGEYGFGLFQFTDAPSQGVYNYTDFANWCSANGKDKNTAGAQTEYLIRGLSSSWSTGLHYSGYYYAAAPQYNGMDVSYDAWLNTNDVGFATYARSKRFCIPVMPPSEPKLLQRSNTSGVPLPPELSARPSC